MDAPDLEHVLHVEVDVAAPIVIGQVPNGVRRVVPILGGRVTGPMFSGRVVPGGEDIQLVRSETELEVVARYVLESDRGELVLVENVGVRVGTPEDLARLARDEPVDPERIYFRSTPRFETASPRLAALTRRVHVATARRLPRRVALDVFAVQ